MPPNAKCLHRLDFIADARGIARRRRNLEKAAARIVAIEPVIRNHPFKAGDSGRHIVMGFTHAVGPVQPFHEAERGPEQRHNEPAVAPARTVPNRLAFEHSDVERRIGGFQVVGRGKSGVARADDGNVRPRFPAQRRSGSTHAPAAVPVVSWSILT